MLSTVTTGTNLTGEVKNGVIVITGVANATGSITISYRTNVPKVQKTETFQVSNHYLYGELTR